MRIVLSYPPDFISPQGLVDIISGYFPKLITAQLLIKTPNSGVCFQAEEIDKMAEEIIRPNWETDIVFIAVSEPIYAYADLLLEDYANTFQEFQLGQRRSLPRFPRIGGYFNMYALRKFNLHQDAIFLSKLAAEEILHIFDVPKAHDPFCFFHTETKNSKVSNQNEYCRKCLTLMKTVKDPLDYQSIYQLVDKIYSDAIETPPH